MVRYGDMVDFPEFFVVVFSRSEANKIRTEAGIKALSERHARILASHFAGKEEAALALSRRGDEINVVGQFGGAVTDDAWALKSALGSLAPSNPFMRTRSAARIERPLSMYTTRRRSGGR